LGYTNTMIRKDHIFWPAAGILHAFLLAVMLTFLAEGNVLIPYFRETIFSPYLEWILLTALVPIGILLPAGLAGLFVELISGERYVISWQGFKQNVRRYWQPCLLLVVTLRCLDVFANMLLPKHFCVEALYHHLTIPALYLLILHIFQDKYLIPLRLARQRIAVDWSDTLILGGIYVLYLWTFYWPKFFSGDGLGFLRLNIFWGKYFLFLTFVYYGHLILRQYPFISQRFNPEKEIFLINPPGGGVLSAVSSYLIRSYPPSFVVVKALSPSAYAVREFNRVIWRKRYYQYRKLVCITCYTFNSYEAYKLAKEFRKRQCTVIMGGPHVTHLPDEALAFCDSVVIGEAEGVWKDVIRDYEQGKLQRKYNGRADPRHHEEVHQALLNSPPEIIKDYLETTRGCKFKCSFCSIPGLSGGRTQIKPVFEVVELLEKIKSKYRDVTFLDNNIYADPAYAKALFQALKPLNIRWQTCSTIDIVKNEETLRLAKESGCQGLMFGYEVSGNSGEARQKGKLALANKYYTFTRKVKKMGISVKAHFIFGFDSDDFRGLWDLWRFCLRLNPYITALSLLTPLPGTGFYDEVLKRNHITNLNWRQYSCHDLVFYHPRMNNVLLGRLHPLITAFFFLSTCKMGYMVLVWFFLTSLLWF
jgi:hypothetical protein